MLENSNLVSETTLLPIASSDYPAAARRPVNSD
ncbi:hypothetical protein D3870_00215 [Noviherbaspirillum cavernae]|uniref:Uncharacterized protein n=1 Tax=Noviherbaspirillum cavernae TaxID=2320862 RepID=A0A418X5K4_9BURK|nr:hypothetical protein D3870_00215 [Noviherbaspirillum cavernae]